MSGACNYLWSTTLWALFHYILFYNYTNIYYCIPLFIFGIICGWTHESITIAASASYFIYFSINKKQINRFRFYQLLGFYIGTLFIIISPAAMNRAIGAASFEGFNPTSIVNCIKSLSDCTFLIIYIILICIYIRRYGSINIKKTLISNFFNIPIIISILFCIIITKGGYYRTHFSIDFFSLLLLIRIISKYKIKRRNLIIINIL